MNPKHHNPTQRRRDRDGNEFWAHAPYNFVPLPERVVTVDANAIPGHDVYTEHTGYIDCILETRSPLYTRCALRPEFFKDWADRIQEMMRNDGARKEYSQCFHLDDAETPAIPGSSLRGMVRALVEIAGYGKMQGVADELLVYRAVGDSSSLGQHYRCQLLGQNKAQQPDTHIDYPSLQLRGGYLVRHSGGWAIQPAREIAGETSSSGQKTRGFRSGLPSRITVLPHFSTGGLEIHGLSHCPRGKSATSHQVSESEEETCPPHRLHNASAWGVDRPYGLIPPVWLRPYPSEERQYPLF